MSGLRGPILPGTSPPRIIAHGGGNTAEATALALGHAADFVEVDLWVHRNAFEARHERRLPFGLPALYEKWYIRRPRQYEDPMKRLLAACREAKAGLFLDLKNGGERPSSLVAAALEALDEDVPVLASSQFWPILRSLGRKVPAVPVFYSIDVVAKLDLVLSVAKRDPIPAGVSCHHRLLSPAVVEQLHEQDLAVVAWTVDTEERALELAGIGVDGLTTHRPAELRAALAVP